MCSWITDVILMKHSEGVFFTFNEFYWCEVLWAFCSVIDGWWQVNARLASDWKWEKVPVQNFVLFPPSLRLLFVSPPHPARESGALWAPVHGVVRVENHAHRYSAFTCVIHIGLWHTGMAFLRKKSDGMVSSQPKKCWYAIPSHTIPLPALAGMVDLV